MRLRLRVAKYVQTKDRLAVYWAIAPTHDLSCRITYVTRDESLVRGPGAMAPLRSTRIVTGASPPTSNNQIRLPVRVRNACSVLFSFLIY